ncbi:MAG: MerR family transcriptional regulator [Nocardioides sp.]
MLTIGQLASYAGVTVRAVRFYHQKGLLPEPDRDHSGYRRYGAAAVVELIRIRTLADAGVPLARVRELLSAGPEEFTAAVTDIDRRLGAEIRTKQEHRRRINRLAAGDSLALPPEAVDYLDHLRGLGFPDQLVHLERDAWILVAARMPERMPALMALKRAQLDNPAVVEMYHDLLAVVDWESDDPRLLALADRLVALFEADVASDSGEDHAEDFDLDDDLAALLDTVFLDTVPIGHRLLELLEERGWTGWTRLERTGIGSN